MRPAAEPWHKNTNRRMSTVHDNGSTFPLFAQELLQFFASDLSVGIGIGQPKNGGVRGFI
jgi:hypothetical protein